MNSSILNFIKDLKSLNYRGLFTPYKVFVNRRKLINPIIDDITSSYIRIIHDRGSLKIPFNNISEVECKREKPMLIKFKFNGNNEIVMEIK